MSSPTKTRVTFEAIFAAILWGFGFPATKLALESFPPNYLIASRFALTVLITAPFILRIKNKSHLKNDFLLSVFPGLMLGLTLILQTLGLQYTTLAKSGFLTVLYTFFVCIFEGFLPGRNFNPRHLIWVGFALLGTALLNGSFDFSTLNKGDILTIGCAIVAAFQMIHLDYYGAKIKHAPSFSVMQSFWAAIPAILFAVLFETLPRSATPRALFGISFLIFGCTLIAFFIQVRAQKELPSSLASMIFLLESPFSAIFGYLYFDEILSATQIVGATLITASACGAILTTPMKRAEVIAA